MIAAMAHAKPPCRPAGFTMTWDSNRREFNPREMDVCPEPLRDDEGAMKGMAAVAASVEEAPGPATVPGLLPGTRSREPAETRAPQLQPIPADLEPSIYRFIIRHSWRPQLALLVFTLASFPFLYASLNLPKTIINHAIAEGASFRNRSSASSSSGCRT